MASKDLRLRISLLLFLPGLVAPVPAFVASMVIGSVAGSTNATLSGQALLPNATVFSGDSRQVKDGVAVVAIGSSSRMVFGRETVASFLRDLKEVTVLLSQGDVSLYHPDDNVALRVRAGTISITPGKGFKTLGDVVMINDTVVVTAKEGLLRVEGIGAALHVAKGKTITVLTTAARAQGASPPVLNAPSAGLSTALSIGSVAGGVLSSVLAGVAISRANGAKDAATAATTAANAAANANKAGCALNQLAIIQHLPSSPYTPPPGFTCP